MNFIDKLRVSISHSMILFMLNIFIPKVGKGSYLWMLLDECEKKYVAKAADISDNIY